MSSGLLPKIDISVSAQIVSKVVAFFEKRTWSSIHIKSFLNTLSSVEQEFVLVTGNRGKINPPAYQRFAFPDGIYLVVLANPIHAGIARFSGFNITTNSNPATVKVSQPQVVSQRVASTLRLLQSLLPKRMHKTLFEQSFYNLLEDFTDLAPRFPGKWQTRWLRSCFLFRVGWMVLQCHCTLLDGVRKWFRKLR